MDTKNDKPHRENTHCARMAKEMLIEMIKYRTYTNQQLSELTDISEKTIRRLLNDSMGPIRTQTWQKILSAYCRICVV